ncbi:helix-turn-helix domain-containing protein, partial [Streptomyces anulatus]|uniref:winged helix-turn-helix domain-containing protein n=1 Tax=Streptomyces anulatus TaxID=1892 RepID=UPI0036641678
LPARGGGRGGGGPRRGGGAGVGPLPPGAPQTIDVHLSWLRRKLGETAARPRYLHTLRGVGVKLQPPADAPADTPVTEPPA